VPLREKDIGTKLEALYTAYTSAQPPVHTKLLGKILFGKMLGAVYVGIGPHRKRACTVSGLYLLRPRSRRRPSPVSRRLRRLFPGGSLRRHKNSIDLSRIRVLGPTRRLRRLKSLFFARSPYAALRIGGIGAPAPPFFTFFGAIFFYRKKKTLKSPKSPCGA